MIGILQIAILGGILTLANGQKTSSPEIPDSIKAPAGEELVLQVQATGSQIYVCQAGADQKLSWVLKAPEAQLSDAKDTVVGTHYAGPTWKHQDGSEVKGKLVARIDAPEPDSIPWLLLTATEHSGTGILSRVTTIQRIHTQGGQPPKTGCDKAHSGGESKVPYSADYYFYAPPR
ncbi:MAG TPA: DUF3455 domain-containing protein [Verrucomicrobiae bacterium]|jgi:hypothetical protein|nr:DUF3455 domain-containing protein [Verrucomicrobiae bacterium]